MANKTHLPKKAGVRRINSKPSKSSREASLALIGIVAVVILITVGIVLLSSANARRSYTATGRTDEGTAWGAVDAPVQIIEYSDYGCSHCADFALNQGLQLRSEYESGGKVHFVAKVFVIGGATTANAANAAYCAADQGRYWDYSNLLYSKQGVGSDPFNKVALKQYASQLGLNAQLFDKCIDNDAHLSDVYDETTEAKNKEVNSTPTFFINGEMVKGALAYSEFKAKIDALIGG